MEKHRFSQYINGKLVEGQGREIDVICPGNNEVAAYFKTASAGQAVEALEAAEKAFPAWSRLSVDQRGEWMLKLQQAIIEEQEALIRLLMLETGKLRIDAQDEIHNLINCFSFCLETAKGYYDQTIRDESGSCFNLMVREPLGVVVGYLAWNFPLHNVSAKIGPILASGCTAVLKPATKTPLSTLYLGEIMEKIGFPAGVINFVAGSASELGKVLTESKIPALISLIGSSEAGRKLVRDSATSIKRFSLELGGNAPFIVTPHACLQEAVDRCVGSQRYVASQNCTGVQRVIVHETVYEQFLNMVLDQGRDVRCGTGDEPDCNMGPMITEASVERMEALVADALKKGGKVILGGSRPADKKKGFYFLPTFITDVTRDMRIFREEIFGPICAIMTYRTMEEAIDIANDTEYGLTAYVWSHKADEITQYARALRFGTISVNGGCDGVHMPHGGIKESGVGKDGGRWSMEEYYYAKGIRLRMQL